MRMAVSWMRTIFSTVRAPQLPAFTVGSLAITATWRPSIVPSPVTTPAAGSSSASTLANRPSSTNEPASRRRSSRSRAVSLCCSRSLGRYRVPPLRAFSRSSRWRGLLMLSPPFEIRLALFQERPDPFFRVVRECHQRELALQVFQGRAELHVLLAVERVSAEAHRHRRLDGQAPGDLVDRRVELVVRYDAVDHPKGLHLRCRPAI